MFPLTIFCQPVSGGQKVKFRIIYLSLPFDMHGDTAVYRDSGKYSVPLYNLIPGWSEVISEDKSWQNTWCGWYMAWSTCAKIYFLKNSDIKGLVDPRLNWHLRRTSLHFFVSLNVSLYHKNLKGCDSFSIKCSKYLEVWRFVIWFHGF